MRGNSGGYTHTHTHTHTHTTLHSHAHALPQKIIYTHTHTPDTAPLSSFRLRSTRGSGWRPSTGSKTRRTVVCVREKESVCVRF
jgi:hypothetical protein